MRQLRCKHRLRPCVLMAGWNRGIGVVAEHAVVTDRPAAWRIALVETGIQCPTATLLGIPGQRKHDQRTARCAMKVRPHVVARTHYIVNLRLSRALLLAFESDLPPPLIPA